MKNCLSVPFFEPFFPYRDPYAGFRPDVAEINNPNQGNEGQWALRAQLQLLF